MPAARLALIGRASAIVLKGQATAQHAGQVDSVGTSLALCAPTVAPADCKNADGFQFWGPMTGATITPIPIAAEQNIQVTVTLSFS